MGRGLFIAVLQQVGRVRGRVAAGEGGGKVGEKGGEGQAQGMPARGLIMWVFAHQLAEPLPPPHAHTRTQVPQLLHKLSHDEQQRAYLLQRGDEQGAPHSAVWVLEAADEVLPQGALLPGAATACHLVLPAGKRQSREVRIRVKQRRQERDSRLGVFTVR